MQVREFFSDDCGAVTVDWVVMTAAVVGLGLAVMTVVSGGVEDLSDDTRQALASVEITTSFGTAAAAAPTIASIGNTFIYVGLDVRQTNEVTMSDGSTWTRTITRPNDGSNSAGVTVWTDGDGNEVDAPEGA
jgi:hypothetical protein